MEGVHRAVLQRVLPGVPVEPETRLMERGRRRLAFHHRGIPRPIRIGGPRKMNPPAVRQDEIPSANWFADHWKSPYPCVMPMPNGRTLAGSVSIELYARVSASGITSSRDRSVFSMMNAPVEGSTGSPSLLLPGVPPPAAGVGPESKLAP